MTEAAMLSSIYRAFGRAGGAVVVPPGDDAAALRFPKGKLLVVSQDDLAEGTHFERRWAQPAMLARRLLGVSLSDLAAMGDVEPLACVISAGLPRALPKTWFARFLAGTRAAAAQFGVRVAGGNLARSSKMFFSCCVLGAGEPSRLVRRGGARPGHVLAGVGPLGEAAAGLELIRRGRVPAWGRSLARAWEAPRPLFAAAKALSRHASAMIDDSDGLSRSIEILAGDSGVSFELEPGPFPAGPALRRWCRERGRDLRRHQLAGGEDYGLVFTVPARAWPKARKAVRGCYRLGRAVPRVRRRAAARGFEHFS